MTCNHIWGSELKTGFLNGSPRHRRKPAVKYHSTNNDILNFVPIVDHFSSVLILISSSSLLPTDRPYCCLNSEPLEPACCWFAMCHLCFYSENPDTLLPSSCSSHICGLLFSSLSSFLLLFFLRTLCLSFVFCWFFFWSIIIFLFLVLSVFNDWMSLHTFAVCTFDGQFHSQPLDCMFVVGFYFPCFFDCGLVWEQFGLNVFILLCFGFSLCFFFYYYSGRKQEREFIYFTCALWNHCCGDLLLLFFFLVVVGTKRTSVIVEVTAVVRSRDAVVLQV